MKKVHFILQRKGGVGKSFFFYILANLSLLINKIAKWVDMDEETSTSARHVKFLKARTYNLINSVTKQIDRTKMDSFFKGVISQKTHDCIVCDLGATTSEQSLRYFESNEVAEVMKMLPELGIELHLHCIVGGDDMYISCSDFAKDLFHVTQDFAQLHIVKNNFHNYTDEQDKDLDKIAAKYNAPIIDFNLISEKGSESQKKAVKVMEDGEPIIECTDVFLRTRAAANIKKVEFDF